MINRIKRSVKRFTLGVGHQAMEFIRYAGGLSILMGETLFWIPMPPLRRRQVVEQMSKIGVDSLPIVTMTSLFTGMVLALQSAYQRQRFSARGRTTVPAGSSEGESRSKDGGTVRKAA